MNTSLQGVNLGGWLVLEKWMTPSVFEGTKATNEYELVQTPGGMEKLRRHHQTFIKEADFKWMRQHGINALRIPVGYWIFGDEPPYSGAIEQLDWALKTADKYRLKVLIDLHGAPGAQNAADHSGSGHPGLPRWLSDKGKTEQTIEVLTRLVTRYNSSKSFWGIELINEPLAGKGGFALIRFYRQAYARLRLVARPGLYIVFSDGFMPLLLTGALGWRKKVPVAMDCHWYQCFSDKDKARNFDKHLKKARRRWLIRFLQLWQPVIVGEWSGVLPWNLLKEVTETDRERMRTQFIAAQHTAYTPAAGTFYWNYKTEKASSWNLQFIAESDPAMLQ